MKGFLFIGPCGFHIQEFPNEEEAMLLSKVCIQIIQNHMFFSPAWVILLYKPLLSKLSFNIRIRPAVHRLKNQIGFFYRKKKDIFI